MWAAGMAVLPAMIRRSGGHDYTIATEEEGAQIGRARYHGSNPQGETSAIGREYESSIDDEFEGLELNHVLGVKQCSLAAAGSCSTK